MATNLKVFACSKEHKIIADTKNERQLLTGKVVCGTCGTKFAEYKSASWSAEKHFLCHKGHVITICPFGNGDCNFSWGSSENEHENVPYDLEKLSEALEAGKVTCPAGLTGKRCGSPLVALEGTKLAMPNLPGIKTSVRVEDVWKKYGCPEPKLGSYDKNYNFKQTEFAQRNKARVQKLKQRRNTKPAGEVVNAPTQRQYRDGARRPTKKEL
jgi:hypothetical protein